MKKEIIKKILKTLLLIAVLIISYLLCMLVFLVVFGTGGQGSLAMNNGFGILLIIISLLITTIIGYKLFSN